MRLLIVAYDFPPNPSPQSLRWAYLVRELAASGHEIRVITADLPGYGPGGLPEIPNDVRIQRVWPGPLSALLRKRRSGDFSTGDAAAVARSDGTSTLASSSQLASLNWKGRLAKRLKDSLSLVLFPDYRAEWSPWARHALRRILSEFNPDVVVTSHEPACSLPLGIEASRQGFFWAADLGDPVLAPYTPLRWRSRARRLERAVCKNATLVSVTSESFARLLSDRHGLDPSRCMVLPQGFDANVDDQSVAAGIFEHDLLELLYTGRFYDFRRADALLDAVVGIEGVRLSIATPSAPEYVLRAAAAHPEKVRILGFVKHRSALQFQRRCDVLVNLANEDPVQIPGKVNEYLGSGRPILHVGDAEADATGRLIEALHAGWHVKRNREEIQTLLRQIQRRHATVGIGGEERDVGTIAAYSWQRLAVDWVRRVELLSPSVQSVSGVPGGMA
ncbi:glycosyltransferase [Rhodanobacter sp. Root627]|uniref:glycosyltransferase n=1 Tax=Rhodanobacter sp. Root627 TaxID=1736572 RepID=UPI000AB69596|nr:glycosyltransferase [Rhodanobacter sp. Root627]